MECRPTEKCARESGGCVQVLNQTFENYRKPTRRDAFLKTMDAIVPCVALCEVIKPDYPKAGNEQRVYGDSAYASQKELIQTRWVSGWVSARPNADGDKRSRQSTAAVAQAYPISGVEFLRAKLMPHT